jgi:hypothetical protein
MRGAIRIVRYSTVILGGVVHRVLVEVDTAGGADRGDIDRVALALGPTCHATAAGSRESLWFADLRVEADDPPEAMRVAHALVLRACSEAGHPEWAITRVEWTRRRWYGSQSEVWQRLTPGEPFAI